MMEYISSENTIWQNNCIPLMHYYCLCFMDKMLIGYNKFVS